MKTIQITEQNKDKMSPTVVDEMTPYFPEILAIRFLLGEQHNYVLHLQTKVRVLVNGVWMYCLCRKAISYHNFDERKLPEIIQSHLLFCYETLLWVKKDFNSEILKLDTLQETEEYRIIKDKPLLSTFRK